MSASHEAEWISWIGVGIAVAGLLFSSPDAIAMTWADARAWIRRAFSRRRPVDGSGGAGLKKMSFRGYGTVWHPWEPDAGLDRQVEVLHIQMEKVREELDNVHVNIGHGFEDMRRELASAEARLRGAHRDLVRLLAAKERRSMHVDARAFWPVGLGILLTGIPGELAEVPAVGWLLVAFASATTIGVALLIVGDWRRSRPRRSEALGPPERTTVTS